MKTNNAHAHVTRAILAARAIEATETALRIAIAAERVSARDNWRDIRHAANKAHGSRTLRTLAALFGGGK